MKLLPIHIDQSFNTSYAGHAECYQILQVYPDFYRGIGFNPPWIGYFLENDNHVIVGCGGYKGKPTQGRVEIAYNIFKAFEGTGCGTQLCKELVQLAQQTDATIKIAARTLPEESASTSILRKNNFECVGIVYDEDDGNVWEWIYKGI